VRERLERLFHNEHLSAHRRPAFLYASDKAVVSQRGRSSARKEIPAVSFKEQAMARVHQVLSVAFSAPIILR
jgi:hypothetical protein